MDTCTVADISRRPSAVLSMRNPVVITNNGRAQNIVFNVSALDIDEVVDLARDCAGRAALAALRKDAAARGLDSLSAEEIDAEIEAVRSGM